MRVPHLARLLVVGLMAVVVVSPAFAAKPVVETIALDTHSSIEDRDAIAV